MLGARGAWRCRCCPATVDGCRRPARARRRGGSPSSSALDLLAAARAELGAPARPARSPRCRCRSAAPTTPRCAGCCWSASASSGPIDFRRAGAALARADPGPGRGRHHGPGPGRGRGGLEAFVVGAMLGSFALPLALGGPRARPGRPDRARRPARRRRPRPCSPRAIALGGAGWRARMLATVPSNLKNPAVAGRPGPRARRRGRPRRHRLGREAARRGGLRRHRRPSARPRPRRRG